MNLSANISSRKSSSSKNKNQVRFSGKHPNSHAREIAMQTLYQTYIYQQQTTKLPLYKFGNKNFNWLNRKPHPEVISYTKKLINLAVTNEEELREMIIRYSNKDWTQISLSIRAILTLAFIELQWSPPALLIDDLLELARKYDGQESVAFVNGVIAGYIEGPDFAKKKNVYSKNK